LAAGCVVASSIFGFPDEADEFDPLAVYEEARVLNDQWQVCVANSIQGRLQPRQKAEQALHRCRSRWDGLNHFPFKRIGGTSASNVMVLLRDRYQSELIIAISELRTRDWTAELTGNCLVEHNDTGLIRYARDRSAPGS
jgi:hypothetical protein